MPVLISCNHFSLTVYFFNYLLFYFKAMKFVSNRHPYECAGILYGKCGGGNYGALHKYCLLKFRFFFVQYNVQWTAIYIFNN